MHRQTLKRKKFTPLEFIPSACQGIIAIECLFDKKHLFKSINDEKTEKVAMIERNFVEAYGGNCRTAIGAYAVFDDKINAYYFSTFVEGKTQLNQIVTEENFKLIHKKSA